MLRFITHILDIKNLCGAQRVNRDNVITMYNGHYQSHMDFYLSCNGTIEIVSSDGTFTYSNLTTEFLSIPSIADGTITIYGNVTLLWLPYSFSLYIKDLYITSNSLRELIVNSQQLEHEFTTPASLVKFAISNCATLGALDISQSVNLQSFTATGDNSALLWIRTRALNSNVANGVATIINDATNPGVVYVPSADPYYTAIQTAAINKGWTVYEL